MANEVFISYSRKDTAIANSICEALDRQGISYFIDRQGIGGGRNVPKVLAEAIVNCRIMLYLASKNSYNSKYTNVEISFAFNEKPQESILPYIIDGSCLPAEQRFLFASTNILTMDEHPIETLVRDICQLLGHEYREGIRKKKDDIAETQITPEIIAIYSDFEAEKEARDNYIKAMEAEINGDYEKTLNLYKKAAEQGNDEAKKAIEKPTLKEEEKHQKMLKELENIGLTRIVKDGGYGFADDSGEMVIPCKWKDAWAFSEGLAAVEADNEKWGFIDKTGKVVIPCKWKDTGSFSEGLAPVVNNNGKWGFIDKAGKVVIPCKWKNAWYFFDGLARIMDDNWKYGFINKAGKVVIPCQWKWVDSFSEGLARVKDDNEKWGYIDKTGNVVIPCQWKDGWDFSNGLADVTDDNGKKWKIDKTGKIVEEIK